MADTKITALPAATTVAGADLATIVQGGSNKQVTFTVIGSLFAPLHPAINTQTGTTYTFALTDDGKIVTLSNANPVVATVPPNTSVAFPVGTTITIAQLGVGATSVMAGVGVTILTADGAFGLRVQYSTAVLIKIDTDTWLFAGDIVAA
jgi:hypothetical protein